MKKCTLSIVAALGLCTAAMGQNISMYQYTNRTHGNAAPNNWMRDRRQYNPNIDTLTLQQYRDTLSVMSMDDEEGIEHINNVIFAIKLANTREILTQRKRPKAFKIGQIGAYNIDTLNAYFYNQSKIDFFENFSLQNVTATGTILNMEVASFLFGPVRMGVASSIKTGNDTTANSTFQKMILNGGALNTNFTLPLYFARSRKESVHFGVFANSNWGVNPNAAADGSASSLLSEDVNFSNQSGVTIHFDAGSSDQMAKLSFDIPVYYAWGNANAAAGVADFSVVQLRTGLVVKNLFSVNVAGVLWSSSNKVQEFPFTLSLQFSPTQLSKAIGTAKPE